MTGIFICLAFVVMAVTIAGLSGVFDSKKNNTPSLSTKQLINKATNKQKARDFLSNLKAGDRITVLVKGDRTVKISNVIANMPSLEKIQLQYKLVGWWSDIYTYSQIEEGLVDLNNLNEIDIDKNEPFLKK